MSRCATWGVAATVLAVAAGPLLDPLAAQTRATATNVPVIPHEAVPELLQEPARASTPARTWASPPTRRATSTSTTAPTRRGCSSTRPQGAFIREIGRNNYGFAFAHSVRVDAQDNIWAVDEGTDMLIKFSPEGKVLMTIGRREDPVDMLVEHAGRGRASTAATRSTASAARPTSPSISRATSSSPTATSTRAS